LFGDVAEFTPSNEGKAHRETAMTTRPERVPAEEIRQRMLGAGRELALEAGAALTIEHLRLEEVIQRARVPRSSAYRLWPYKEDYIEDLLCYLAGAGRQAEAAANAARPGPRTLVGTGCRREAANECPGAR
jgi:AcrR family transcriptional regulator